MRTTLIAAALLALTLSAGCSDSAGEVGATPTTIAPTESPAPTPATSTAAPTPTHSELTPGPGLESAPPVGAPTCKGNDLTITDADTLVTADSRQEVYAIRTTGPACQLRGYPAVSFRDAAGSSMAIATRHGGYGLPPEQPETVTISRSTSLSFTIASARTGSCSDVAKVVVTLPQTTGAHTVPTELRVCGSTVGLSPVERRGDIH